MSRRKRPRKAPSDRPRSSLGPWAAGLVLLSLALYLNTLGHGFVFDDGALILQNPQVTQFRLGEMFGSAGYRPVRTLTYALNYAVGGAEPFGFHLFNVLLHAGCALLLFRLMTLWGLSAAGAAAGAAFFSSHPVQSAAVAYVSGRKDLLATAFLLGGMTLYTRYRREGGWKPAAASMALFALAVFSKEVAVVFPVLLLLAELLIFAQNAGGSPIGRFAAAVRERPLGWISALLVAGAGTYYILAVSKATRMIGFWGGGPAANYGTSLKLFAHYLKLAVWPHPLIADYKGDVFVLSPGFADPATLLAGLTLAVFLGLAVWAVSKAPRIAFGMLWFLTALAPVLQIIPFHEIAADHFLYLPLAGFGWIVAEAMHRLVAGPRRRAAWGAFLAVALAFSILTVNRNRDWADSRSLWEATLKSAPGSYRANANLGKLYFSDPGMRPRALELTRRAVELEPGDPVALSNLGAMAYVQAQSDLSRGDLGAALEQAEKAVQLLEEALAKNPRDGSVLSNLGNGHKLIGAVLRRRGGDERAQFHWRRAAEYFEAALSRDRRDEVKAAWYNFALLHLETGNYAAAANCLREFLKVRPGHPAASLQLGWCEIQMGRPEDAIAHLETAAAGSDPASAREAKRLLSQLGR